MAKSMSTDFFRYSRLYCGSFNGFLYYWRSTVGPTKRDFKKPKTAFQISERQVLLFWTSSKAENT